MPDKKEKPVSTTSAQSVNIFVTTQFWMFIAGLLAVALIGVIVVTCFLPSKQSDTQTPNNNGTPTAQATGLPTITQTTSATPKPDENVSVSAATMQFTSDELGITFRYAKKNNGQTISVKRVGNKVYVYNTAMDYKNGQSVEVFTKQSLVTMESDIQTRFLTGYSSANCYIVSYPIQSLPFGYSAKKIQTPPASSLEDMENKLKLCPQGYTASNGISYFEGSNVREDRYVYLSIGQDTIAGDTSSNTWQDTLRFIPKQ